MQDWNYLNSDCLELTMEISNIKFPAEEKLENYWKDNSEPLFRYIEMVRTEMLFLIIYL